ncbi:MAG: FeoB-associated Cys-rich membrane protein [Mogibacterium sp.]|nr:FeoB-associated Cys-rich membrane protein [Mogibacterium sp.]
MIDEIIIAVLVMVSFMIIRYLVKEKAKGKRCIGCIETGCCGSCSKEGSCHCGENGMDTEKNLKKTTADT